MKHWAKLKKVIRGQWSRPECSTFRLIKCAGWFILAALSLSGSFGCREQSAIVEISDTWWNQSYDAGYIFITPGREGDRSFRHTFEVHNPTDHALMLELVGTSCGCTQAIVRTESVPPGESGLVELVVDLAGQSGYVAENALLATGVSTQEHVRLAVSAEVIPRMDVSGFPPRPIAIRPGTEHRFTFVANVRRPKEEEEAPLSCNVVPESVDGIVVQVGDQKRSVPHGDYELESTEVHVELRCPREREDGTQLTRRATIRLESGESRLERVVQWQQKFPIEVSPQRVFLRRGRDLVAEKVVTLSSNRKFSVLDCVSSSDSLVADFVDNGAATVQEVVVQALARASTSPVNAERIYVDVKTDHPEQATVRLHVLVLEVEQRLGRTKQR